MMDPLLQTLSLRLRILQLRVQTADVVRRGTPVFGAGHKIIGNIGEDGVFHLAGEGKAITDRLKQEHQALKTSIAADKAAGRTVSDNAKTRLQAYKNEIARHQKGDFTAPTRTTPSHNESDRAAYLRAKTEYIQHGIYQDHGLRLAGLDEGKASYARRLAAMHEEGVAYSRLSDKAAAKREAAVAKADAKDFAQYSKTPQMQAILSGKVAEVRLPSGGSHHLIEATRNLDGSFHVRLYLAGSKKPYVDNEHALAGNFAKEISNATLVASHDSVKSSLKTLKTADAK